MVRLSERLFEETRPLQRKVEHDAEALLAGATPATYRQFLTRTHGFISPLERSLADTPGIRKVLDRRRLRKRVLLEHDLQALGLRPSEVETLPQCMSIPWFDNVHDALGWAYFAERGTLGHAKLFRLLASSIPGEVAFAASYLKCYVGSTGDMWRSFADDLETAVTAPVDRDRVAFAATTSFHHFRRWCNTLDDGDTRSSAMNGRMQSCKP